MRLAAIRPQSTPVPLASFTTLGCKVNQYETQAILNQFEEAGFGVVPFGEPCDVVVVNTCSVTGDAESKSRYTLRRAKRQSPGAVVVATGCAAQMALNHESGMADADLVVPNPQKLDTLARVAEAYPELAARAAAGAKPAQSFSSAAMGRSRATLKVQDGCSVHCTYCSIPFTRPVMASRPWQDVLAEAQKLAEQGCREAILTGVLIGSYGPETGSGGPRFVELVRLLARESGLPRLRISSIEAHQVTEEVLELVEEGAAVPHLHIPLQSGSDQVLRDMNRRYRQEDFIRVCRELERRRPEAVVTTDIMVGFPTETEEEFEQTLHVCQEVRFLKSHVFRFSPRPGTPADQWGDPIPPEVKQERSRRVTDLTEATACARMRPWLGRTVQVLVERKAGKDGLWEGLTANWLSVKFVGPQGIGRTLQTVRLDQMQGSLFHGELIGRQALTLLR
jgi:threonylcarbamoyladenosine tRNA methylthiotransferase MtaB